MSAKGERERHEVEKTRGYFLFFFMPGMSRKILICGFSTVCSHFCLCVHVYRMRARTLLKSKFHRSHARNTRSITFYYYSYGSAILVCCFFCFGVSGTREGVKSPIQMCLICSETIFCFVLLAHGEW